MLWLDAQLSPTLAEWIAKELSVPCVAVRDIGLRDAADAVIFNEAKQANAIVVTKDQDFIELLRRLGAPPKVIWLTCGNTSNEALKKILANNLSAALEHLSMPAVDMVEIR